MKSKMKMKTKKKTKTPKDSTGVCEDTSGMRFTCFKKESAAQDKLNELISIGVMNNSYKTFKCKKCGYYHIAKFNK